ncbi:uncharacterized protein LOC134259595 [Saccostrea cucullata]|uniref:uncharacterized protein LOC134259595 n=1 Tax=Saccostrea cuccullata TaxID=36930 RepID=UPI002ED54D1D
MHCNGAGDIENCFLNTVRCGDLEDCYLDKYVDENSVIRYDAGCRSKQVCSGQGRRRRRLVVCTSCCSDAPDHNGPCNAKLCGIGPVTYANSTCVVCEGVHSDVTSCSSTSVCPPNEASLNIIQRNGMMHRIYSLYRHIFLNF